MLLPGSATADDESGEVVVTAPYAGSQQSSSEGSSNDIGIDFDVDIWGLKPGIGGSHRLELGNRPDQPGPERAAVLRSQAQRLHAATA